MVTTTDPYLHSIEKALAAKRGGVGRAGVLPQAFSSVQSPVGPIGSVERSERLEKLRRMVDLIGQQIIRETAVVTALEICDPAEPIYNAPPREGDWQAFQCGASWGGEGDWAWFRGILVVPSHWRSNAIQVCMKITPRYFEDQGGYVMHAAGPEGQMFLDGFRAGAIDRQHRTIRWLLEPGQQVEMSAVFYAGRCPCRHELNTLELQHVSLSSEKLWYDLQITLDVIDQLNEDSHRRYRLIEAVEAVIAAIDYTEIPGKQTPVCVDRDPKRSRFDASIEAAQARFGECFSSLPSAETGAGVHCVGHAHLDLAWLWTTAITRHKAVRTFSTQVRLLNQFEDWVFNQSSPQLYQWLEADAPEIFSQIKELIAKKRWEADGAMWVEADTNLPSGESLVRQLLYGKRYFREKLGIESRMLWLPDVFGYSAALPQLLHLAGVKSFVTSKLSWNQYNRFPHDTFRWRGLDGTEIPTHFITTPCENCWLTYNAMMTVDEVVRNHQIYRQKDKSIRPLLTFGFGDGGGGPTEEMLQIQQRLQDNPGGDQIPHVVNGKAAVLMDEIVPLAHTLPVWDGELYLERHRGTYTSQAWLKRANRQAEIALHQVEWLSVLAAAVGGRLDRSAHDQAWQSLLLTQFHDILPGSAIREVYDEAREVHAKIDKYTHQTCNALTERLAVRIDTSGCSSPMVLFNTLPWDRCDPIALSDGQRLHGITVPAGGWCVVDAASSELEEDISRFEVRLPTIGTPYWRINLAEDGSIATLIDLQNDRQILDMAGGNVWQLFEDRPLQHDAWDIDFDFEIKRLDPPALTSQCVVEHTDKHLVIEQIWQVSDYESGPNSRIIQNMVFYAEHPRIDFQTHIDWYEHHKLLKVAFALNLRAMEAIHEIQFGHVCRPTHRNHSWDRARFETCAHRFVSLQEYGYSVSLLNDCKYGHDVRDGTMRLTCIKSAQSPDPTADRGEHTFTYALLPCVGSFQEAGVIQAAAELNNPVIVQPTDAHTGELPASHAAVCCTNHAIVVDTMKPAEDGDGVVLRLYESFGSHAEGIVQLGFALTDVAECDLLEQPLSHQSDLVEGGVRVALRPFEVKTLRLKAEAFELT